MEKSFENGIMTISGLPKRVDTTNATKVEDELLSIIEQNSPKGIVLDFSSLEYISSAGLRIVLKVKKTVENTRIENVSMEVYEVFEMSGFTSMIDVSKQRRTVDIKGASLVGEGFFSKVYRLDSETIVKQYIQDTSLDDIKRELNLAKQAFINGVPTAISFDVVDVEGKYGVVFELLDCGSLRDAIAENPDKQNYYIDKYVQLMVGINNTSAGDAQIPDAKEIALKKVDVIATILDPEDVIWLKDFINEIPDKDTYVHGDCHIKNIMLSGEELLIIDMDTLSKGSFFFELSLVYCTYVAFEQLYPGNNKEFLGVSKETTKIIMNAIYEGYFKDNSDEECLENIRRVKVLAYMHMIFWLSKFRPEAKEEISKSYEMLKEVKKTKLE